MEDIDLASLSSGLLFPGPRADVVTVAIETPKFGKRAAKDMSQPKAGNKSGTFT